MKVFSKLIMLIAVSSIFTSCLKGDVLKGYDDKLNFQESDYYTSGRFHQEAALDILSVEILDTISGNNTPLCNARFKLALQPSLRDNLNSLWMQEVEVKIERSVTNEFTFIVTPDYSGNLELNMVLGCGGDQINLPYRIALVAPTNGRVIASTEKVISYSF